MMKRDYIETYTGRDVYLPDADPDSISIIDIAHALSMVPRFAGHIDKFYSVAEHSINVAWIVPEEHRLQGLLHDATEAYLCDIPTPYKRMIPEYKALEDNLWATIAEKFGVPFELSPEVKYADRVMLLTERDNLKENTKKNWSEEYENTPRWDGFKNRSTLYVSDMATLFLRRFHFYGGTVG